MTQQITSADFEDKVLKADKPVLVDFFATWCGPCKMVSPVVEEVAGEMGDIAYVYKLDVDESPDIAQQYGVMSIPTLAVFENGEVKKQILGAQPKSAIKDLFA